MGDPSTRLLPFVQLEFTHALGPAEGRYVVVPDGASDGEEVLLLGVAPAPAARRRRPRGARAAQPGADAGPVSLALATHVRMRQAGEGEQALACVRECREDRTLQSAWIDDALQLVNRAIRAHRATCGDPYFTELTAGDARAVRIGYGLASEVSAGRWRSAFTVPPAGAPKLGRAQRNGPSEVVAAALAGHPVALQADELILRALLDLDQERMACAALQLHAAARMLAAELGDERAGELPALAVRLERLPLAEADGAAGELQEAAIVLRTATERHRAELLADVRDG